MDKTKENKAKQNKTQKKHVTTNVHHLKDGVVVKKVGTTVSPLLSYLFGGTSDGQQTTRLL